LGRYGAVAKRFPDNAEAHVEVGIALRELGRLDEAEATLALAMQHFPSDRHAPMHHARIAADRQDWEESLRRYRALADKFADEPEPYIEIGVALRELGNLDAAEEALQLAIKHFP